MSNTHSIKRHNHKVHICAASRKESLLKHLISLYEDKKILVISKANSTTTEIKDKNLTLSNDAGLSEFKNAQFDVLISFDLPDDVDTYMNRLAYTSTIALILLNEKEGALLYPIDMALGKNLPREVVPGFEILHSTKVKNPPHRPTKAQLAQEEEAKQKIRDKQEKLRERAAKRGEEVSEEDLKKIEADATKYLKDSKADSKEKNSLGKKEWDKPKGDKKPWEKKSNDYRGKKDTPAKRTKRVIKIPSNKQGTKD
jgi:superfamily II DNA/RNA helicase